MKDKILIVDDDPLICEGLTYVLKDKYDVVTASSGRGALLKAETEKFSVVLTDLVMPGVDGKHVLREIKRSYPQTQVIMITAHATVDNAIEAMKEGASDYICKPFDIKNVQKSIVRALKEAAFERIDYNLEQKLDNETIKVSISKDSILKTLSNPIRREAMEFLVSGDYSFTEILTQLDIDDPTKLSFHLRILKSVKFVKQDDYKIYSLSDQGKEIAKLLSFLSQMSDSKGTN
tara:strand:- start:4 stop:702 length:699 start_codon:yes stop_codon:yes gene_type:complete